MTQPTERQRGRRWMTRRKLWLMAQPFCQHCQRQGTLTLADEVDHIIPLLKGGPDDESNLQSLCSECHKLKTAEDKGYKTRVRIGMDGWPIEKTNRGE